MRKSLCVAALAALFLAPLALAGSDSPAVPTAPRTASRVPQMRTRYESGVAPNSTYYRSYVRGWHASYGNRPASSKVLGNY